MQFCRLFVTCTVCYHVIRCCSVVPWFPVVYICVTCYPDFRLLLLGYVPLAFVCYAFYVVVRWFRLVTLPLLRVVLLFWFVVHRSSCSVVLPLRLVVVTFRYVYACLPFHVGYVPGCSLIVVCCCYGYVSLLITTLIWLFVVGWVVSLLLLIGVGWFCYSVGFWVVRFVRCCSLFRFLLLLLRLRFCCCLGWRVRWLFHWVTVFYPRLRWLPFVGYVPLDVATLVPSDLLDWVCYLLLNSFGRVVVLRFVVRCSLLIVTLLLLLFDFPCWLYVPLFVVCVWLLRWFTFDLRLLFVYVVRSLLLFVVLLRCLLRCTLLLLRYVRCSLLFYVTVLRCCCFRYVGWRWTVLFVWFVVAFVVTRSLLVVGYVYVYLRYVYVLPVGYVPFDSLLVVTLIPVVLLRCCSGFAPFAVYVTITFDLVGLIFVVVVTFTLLLYR